MPRVHNNLLNMYVLYNKKFSNGFNFWKFCSNECVSLYIMVPGLSIHLTSITQVTCEAKPTSDATDQIQSTCESEEIAEYENSTSTSSSDESEKFIGML